MLRSFLNFPDKLLRSSWLAGAIAIIALVVGVPLFLRMPPWCDLTLYDVAARTVIDGGTMYRDVFDTNLPGFVWCLIAIRRLGGDSVEVVRAVDLLVVTAIVCFLIRFLRAGGADRGSVAWFAASVALFYPFTSEFSHAQRDVWMTLPMILAVSLRVRHIEGAAAFDRRGLFRASLVEGAVWAVAVWFKPHVLLVAAAMWFVTLRARRRSAPHVAYSWRVDLLGYFAGGGGVAIAGILALLATGTWSHLTEVLFKWNARYLDSVWGEWWDHINRFAEIFPPWSLLNFLGVPLAIFALVRMIGWLDPRRFRSGVLAGFYLAMVLQTFTLQRNFDYVHVPETLLLLAMLAMLLPRLLALYVIGVLAVTLLRPDLFQHRIMDTRRTDHWSECFRSLPTVEHRERQHTLALSFEYCSAVNPVEIGEVADWLREQGVREGEVIAWHDTPHAIYLELGFKPTFRFMHIMTTLISTDNFWRATRELRKVLPRTTYVVSDVMHPLRHCTLEQWNRRGEAGPDRLPPYFTPRLRQSFPYDQPAVFRSGGGHGRYIVHRVTDPDVKHFEFEWDVWEK